MVLLGRAGEGGIGGRKDKKPASRRRKRGRKNQNRMLHVGKQTAWIGEKTISETVGKRGTGPCGEVTSKP